MKWFKFTLFSALLLAQLIFSGCGSDQSEPSANGSKATTHNATSGTARSTVTKAQASELHQSGLDLFSAALRDDDSVGLLAAIGQLEEACLANPEMSGYWVDLADAYLFSENKLLIPEAIEIYWQIYQSEPEKSQALLTRLSNAYQAIGNEQAAFDLATERLQTANGKELQRAALDFIWLAMENGFYRQTADVLTARDPKNSELQILAANLYELQGDSKTASQAIELALANLPADSKLAQLAQQVRRGIGQ